MTRPKLITCNVASVDGRITIAPGVSLMAGDSRWTAIAGSAEPYEWVRRTHDPDVLLEGSGSLVDDDASPIAYPRFDGDASALYEDHLPDAIVEVPGRRWMAIVDGRGRVQIQFTEWPEPGWEGWHVLVITSRAAPAGHLAWMRSAGIPHIVAGDGPVDLAAAIDRLGDRLGARTIVSTAGGRLNGALLRAGLVDEVDIEYLPAVIGGRGTPALFDAPPLATDEQPVPLHVLSVETLADDHLRVRYVVG